MSQSVDKSDENLEPDKDDIVFIVSITNNTRSRPVFEYFTQENESQSDLSDLDDFVTPLVTSQPISGIEQKKSTSEEDDDEDIQLIYDNRSQIHQVDCNRKKLNPELSNVETECYSEVDETVSTILVDNHKESIASTTDEPAFIVLDSDDDDDDDEIKLDESLKNHPKTLNSHQKGEHKMSTANVSSKRTILLEKPIDDRRKRRKLLVPTPALPKPATTPNTSVVSTSSEEPDDSGISMEEEAKTLTTIEKETNKNNNIEMDESSNDSSYLNPIDAVKKKLMKHIKSRNGNFTRCTVSRQLKANHLTREQLISISKHKKARQLLVKSHHQNNVSSGLSLTQSINVAKIEHKMRLKAFEAEKAKMAEKTNKSVQP